MNKELTKKPAPRGRYKTSDETRQRILKSAEKVFAAEGLNVSMRKIMNDAGVNVSSINYHFGDRETLLRSLLDDRSQEINTERLALLDGVLGNGGAITPEAIVEALLRPALGPDRRNNEEWRRFLKVRTMLTAESSDVIRQSMSKNYDNMHGRFIDALRLAAPHLSKEDVYWRYHCLLGVQSQSTALGYRIHDISGGTIDLDDPQTVLDHLIPLMAKLFD